MPKDLYSYNILYIFQNCVILIDYNAFLSMFPPELVDREKEITS